MKYFIAFLFAVQSLLAVEVNLGKLSDITWTGTGTERYASFGSSGGSPVLFASQEVEGDYWTGSDFEQEIQSGGTISVTSIEAKFLSGSSSSAVFRIVQGATTVGETSAVSVPGGGWTTFTFSSPVSVTGDFNIHFASTGGNVQWITGTGDPYAGPTYRAYHSGSWDASQDFTFRIYKQP